MDDQEGDYLRGRVRELERSRARWRAAAALLAGVVVVLAVAGGVSTVLLGKTWREKREQEQAVERALRQEQDALAETLAKSRDLLDEATRRERAAEEVRQRATAIAPVAGGLAAAALAVPVDDR